MKHQCRLQEVPEGELPEVVVENMHFFFSDNVRDIPVQYRQEEFFDLLSLLCAETAVACFVGAGQCISQFAGIEVIRQYILVRFCLQQASDVLYHFFGIDITLHHHIGSMQVVCMLIH